MRVRFRVLLPLVVLVAGGVAAGGVLLGRATAPSAPSSASATMTRTVTQTSPPTSPPTPVPTPSPAPRRPRVALFGDSLFYGSGLAIDQDYEHDLSRLRPDVDFVNDGYPGATSQDLFDRIRGVTEASPDTVVVWIGTNDALNGVGAGTFTRNLRSLLDMLVPARVVLVTPIADQSNPGAVPPYIAAVKAVGAERKVPVVDLAGVVTSAGDYQADGGHLNEAAALRVSQAVAAAL